MSDTWDRLRANIAAGRSPLTDDMLRTIRANAAVDMDVPPPRVLQLVDEVERLREQVADLRGWTCESCRDTNPHHCTTCVAAGRG